jgi:hypothetical protein
VEDLACLHRFANFARIYPRYRDLDYLRAFMPQWDSAIDRIIVHDRYVLGIPEELQRLCDFGADLYQVRTKDNGHHSLHHLQSWSEPPCAAGASIQQTSSLESIPSY